MSETNRLETFVQFKPESLLHKFLIEKSGRQQTSYTVQKILQILREVICKEKLYDPSNPAIILCSTELERVLNMRALHVSEVWERVVLHLENMEELRFYEIWREPGPIDFRNRFYGDPSVKFRLQPNFLELMRTVEDSDKTKTIYSYRDITMMLTKYVCSKRQTIVDPRNLKLALLNNDPLKDVFKVTAFHRCQARTFLDKQLICVDLKHEAAWEVARRLRSVDGIEKLEVPAEVRSLIRKMSTDTEKFKLRIS